jgi:hypothetical protein
MTEPNWSEMLGGYRLPYDPRPTIAKLRENPLDPAAWAELWSELHHQGDVGEASYAAVPLLVDACSAGPRDWNLFALLATIEVERHRRRNPPLPDALANDYAAALATARDLALADLALTQDPLTVRSALGLVALADGALELGALLSHLDSDEVTELLEQFLAWGELYDVGAS